MICGVHQFFITCLVKATIHSGDPEEWKWTRSASLYNWLSDQRLSDYQTCCFLFCFVLVLFWVFLNNCHKKVFVVAQQDVWKCIMETTGTALRGCRRWREVAGDGDERISGASCRLAGGRSWGQTALANRNAALRPGPTVLSKSNALHRSPQLDVLNMHLEPANTPLANWRFFLCFVQMLLIPLNFQMATSSKKKNSPKTFKLINKIWITSLVWNMFFYANNKKYILCLKIHNLWKKKYIFFAVAPRLVKGKTRSNNHEKKKTFNNVGRSNSWTENNPLKRREETKNHNWGKHCK